MTDGTRAGRPGVSVRDLCVSAGGSRLVSDVDLEVAPGEVVTLFGPSGAGKSTVAAAVAGLARPGVQVSGTIDVGGGLPGHLPQHAAETLNPSRRIGTALSELLLLHGDAPRGRRARRQWLDDRLAALLRTAGFPADDTHTVLFLRRHPFEFSGGQRTRLALAQVLATDPGVLVLDEPTNGLDERSRDALVDMLGRLRDEGRAILLVTHDPEVDAALSDRTVHLDRGRAVESPAHTPGLPARRAVPATGSGGPPALEVRELGVRLGGADLVAGVSLTIDAGETLGLVGPSGAGKSTVARAVAGLVPLRTGQIRVAGRAVPRLGRRTRAEKSAVQLVWQEAAASFVPWEDVLGQVARTAVTLRGLGRSSARREALAELDGLGLDEATSRRRPDELSGGQLRRAAIARALLARPRVLVCDEITTGLDRRLATRILDRVDAYRAETDAAVLLISHDLVLSEPRFDRVVALDAGRVQAGSSTHPVTIAPLP